jgi:transposase
MDIRLDALPSDPAALQAIIHAQAAALRTRDTLIDRLRAQLAALKRARFGASSEKLDRAIEQLELMLEDGEATLAEAAPTGPSPEPAETPDRPARQAPPPHLPREEVRHEPAPVCPDCGGRSLRKRGEDVTEVLEYVPASFRVIRHVRPRYACCDCDTPVQAPTPSLPIERGKPGPGLVAHVLCAKYCDHLPLYRQSDIYAREGVEIARSTLADWVGRASALMAPLIEALRAHIFAGDRLHGDDTPVPVLDPGRGRTGKAGSGSMSATAGPPTTRRRPPPATSTAPTARARTRGCI